MGICQNFNIYTNNCNLAYIFKKRKNSYVVLVKQKVNRKYQFFRRDVINGTSQSALNNYIYTKVYTQFSSTSTVA